MSTTRRAAWIGTVPSHWSIIEPRRLFGLRRELERASDVHLTPSQTYGVVTQQEYMALTGARVVQNLSGTTMQHVEPGDFISHLRTFQGGLELATISGKVSPAYTVLSPRANAFPGFYRHALKSKGYISQIASITDQLRDGQSMRYAEFNETWLPLPPLEEQRQIADYLDHETAEIDAFIADLLLSRELTIERTRSFASLQIEHAATEPASDTILSHVIDVNAGQVDPAIDNYADLPLIAPNHIESRTGRLLSLESAREQGAISGKYSVRAGQVLYSKIRPALMKATIAPCDSLCAADMYAMDARRSWLSNEYLLEYLLSDRFEQYAVTMSDRVAMPKLNRDTLGHAPIRIPSAEIQARAVLAIKDARRAQFEALVDIDAAIALAKERRAALITAAVTGQIDVTTNKIPVVESIPTAIEESR